MQKILVLDPEKCTGCRLCALACSFGKEKEFNLMKSRIGIVWIPNIGMNIAMVCQQCAKPLCEDVCPMRAIYRNERTGAMLINPDLCIGCKMCMIVCPFGGPSIDIETGTMIKCDLCDGDPECVKYCVYGALDYVPADEATFTKRRAGAERLAEALKKIVE